MIGDMKKLRLPDFVIGLMLAVGLNGCADRFLDESPDERVEVTTLSQVIQLAGSAYSTGNYGWLCELSSDNIIDINAPYMATQDDGREVPVRYNLREYERMDGEAYRFEPVKSSNGTDSPSEIWEGCYHAIATANHAFQILDGLRGNVPVEDTSEKMRAAYAELYLIRAYHHFILVNVFSQAYKDDNASRNDIGIPYCMTPEDVVKVDYDRSNVTDTYDRIESDLERGLDLISDVNYEKPKWHFNVKAAHAFAARFYLFRREYDKVIEHADAVLGRDASVLPSVLMDYSVFDDCVTSEDFAEAWQNPDSENNLMLIATYSVQFRRHIGYRYATAGKALKDIEYHYGPNWDWFLMPAASVGGGTFYDGNADHGFTSARIAERFEYTDKIAGIGYAHIVRREFTCTELLLERAEARLLGNHDKKGCAEDLIAYENSRQSFSKSNLDFYTSGGALRPLTESMIERWYSTPGKSNVIADWTTTDSMSLGFNIPKDLYPYMNCLNDMRRYETAYTGLRFFDLKRFGIEYTHIWNAEGTACKLKWNDPRRAIEVPQDVLAAGMASSYLTPSQVSHNVQSRRMTGLCGKIKVENE